MMQRVYILMANNINLDTLVIAIVGYLIVFTALVLLFLFFNNIPKIIYFKTRRERRKRGEAEPDSAGKISGEETAAISMALHMCFSEMHDEESGVLTIKKVSKTYSPWSSKIYAVRNQFNRL